MRSALRPSRIKPFAACLASAFGLSLPSTSAASTWNVNRCDVDSSALGTLRWAIGVAGDLDHIDMHTSLPVACSTITLTAGELKTIAGTNTLYLDGPSDRTLTIFQSQGASAPSGPYFRVLHHVGTGRLVINHLTISSGKYYSASSSGAAGGCIHSDGDVYLNYSTVTGCKATAAKPSGGFPAVAQAGGIYAAGVAKLNHSVVTANVAFGFGSNNNTDGGGIVCKGGLRSYYSTISGNSANGVGSSNTGGAAIIGGGATIKNSTIDGNSADFSAAIYQVGGGAFVLSNSTISGNHAVNGVAVYAAAPMTIHNSTIAFNSGSVGSAIEANADVEVDGTIIAKNSLGTPGFADLYVDSPHTLSGSHNLIVSSNQSPSGGFTLTSDPRLTLLANHGGETRTHALLATSPALDRGIDEASTLGYDQRSFPFSRDVGGVDVGAYERQINDDEIFYDGFE